MRSVIGKEISTRDWEMVKKLLVLTEDRESSPIADWGRVHDRLNCSRRLPAFPALQATVTQIAPPFIS